MAGTYSVKINKAEGSLEILGEDKAWVDSKLAELSDVFKNFQPVRNSESGAVKDFPKASPTKTGVLRQKARSKTNSSSSRPQMNEDLQKLLTTEVKGNLKKYVDNRKKAFDKSQPAQAAILATFLLDELNWSGVDHNDLYTVYRVMGYEIPTNINSQLINARQRNSYFGNIVNRKFTLSVKGETYARQDSLAKQNET